MTIKTLPKFMALVVAGLMVSVSCNVNKSNTNIKTVDSTGSDTTAEATVDNEETTAKKDSNVLIVFFSHVGDNYSVGNIKVGNTKLVADEVQKQAKMSCPLLSSNYIQDKLEQLPTKHTEDLSRSHLRTEGTGEVFYINASITSQMLRMVTMVARK